MGAIYFLLQFFAGAAVVLVFVIAFERAKRCDCGKSRPYFLDKSHPRLRWLIGDAVMKAAFTISTFLAAWSLNFVIVIWVILFILSCFRIYYHEKDKLKKAARALGKVIVTDTGRLAVVKE